MTDEQENRTLSSGIRCGGTIPTQVNAEITALCEKHLAEISSRSNEMGRNGTLDRIQVVEALTQVVAGTNYFLKVKVLGNTDEYFWVRIHQDLAGKSHLHSLRVGLTEVDTLSYFSTDKL